MNMVFIPNRVFMMLIHKIFKFYRALLHFLLIIGVIDNDRMRARNTTVYG
jgi:hypothetical protein